MRFASGTDGCWVNLCPFGHIVTHVSGTDLDKLVRPERFELPTSWFVARRSIQLSYGRIGIAAGPANPLPFRAANITTSIADRHLDVTERVATPGFGTRGSQRSERDMLRSEPSGQARRSKENHSVERRAP
jgi:hypothetical protein